MSVSAGADGGGTRGLAKIRPRHVEFANRLEERLGAAAMQRILETLGKLREALEPLVSTGPAEDGLAPEEQSPSVIALYELEPIRPLK